MLRIQPIITMGFCFYIQPVNVMGFFYSPCKQGQEWEFDIRQTVDYGKREGDIRDSGTGNHIRQGVSELRTSARPVLHTLGNNDGRMPVYSEKRFGLIRELALLAE